MPKYSAASKSKLATCHPDIQRLFNEVIKHVDCTIIEGKRTRETQEEYVRTGKSQTMKSKHLEQDDGYSWAVDVMAYPIRWEDWKRNAFFAGYVMGLAKSMGIDLRTGIDWDSDFDISEHSFLDAPHFELRSASKPGTMKPSNGYLPDGPSEDDISVTLEDIERSTLG